MNKTIPMKKYAILLLLFTVLVLNACDDNGNDPDLPEVSSLYVTNEGDFQAGNGSITAYIVETNTASQKAFENTNDMRPLAGIVQSADVKDGRMYINLNRADKIEVADLQSLTSIATIPLTTSITALQVVDDSKAYATNLYFPATVDSVSVIDLVEGRETDVRIPVGDEPGDMVQAGNRVFVANTGFGGSGKSISVIDTETDEVTQEIEVGYSPTKLVLGSNNQLWVVCAGLAAYDEDFNRDPANDEPGSIYLVDTESAAVIDQLTVNGRPTDMVLDENNNRGYLLDSGVKVVNLATREVVQTLFEAQGTSAIFYSAREELLYVGKRPKVDPFVQPGQVIRYNLDGAAVDSFQTGIAPNGFVSVDE
jgi:YVTN family beta-propeller protein